MAERAAGEGAGREEGRLTLPLASGPLTVQAVGINALAFIDTKYGLNEFYTHTGNEAALRAWMETLNPDRSEQLRTGLDLVANYCLTWGVADDPPSEDLELLRAMGVETDNERVLRLYWLRLVRLTDDEASAAMFAIRRLTFASAQPAEEPDETEEAEET